MHLNLVRNQFGERKLTNPLGGADFGHSTINQAEANIKSEDMEVANEALDSLTLRTNEIKSEISKGAAGKFQKKRKKKNKAKNF